MTEGDTADLALLLLRLLLATVMFAHGWAHVFRGGRIPGVARWFESLGMRPGRLHAWLASLTEIGVAPLLALGLLTPFAAAAAAAVLLVAWVTNHRDAGFFVFNRPTEGYEYVMTLVVVALAVALLGPGGWSLDAAFNLATRLDGLTGLAIFVVAGIGGAAGVLAGFWRPADTAADEG